MINNGIYAAYFTGNAGSGFAVLVFRDGVIAGADAVGARIQGQYSIENHQIAATVTFTFLESAKLATSGQVMPGGFTFPFQFSAPVNEFLKNTFRAETPQGSVNVRFKFVVEAP